MNEILRLVIFVCISIVIVGIVYLWLCLVRFLVAGEDWFTEQSADAAAEARAALHTEGGGDE